MYSTVLWTKYLGMGGGHAVCDVIGASFGEGSHRVDLKLSKGQVTFVLIILLTNSDSRESRLVNT